jgi:hypothetical protein
MCFSLCNAGEPQNLDPVNLYNIVEYKQGQVKGWQFDYTMYVVLIKQNLLTPYDSFSQMSIIYLTYIKIRKF